MTKSTKLKLLVAVAHEVATALNEAAARAMEKGAYEIDVAELVQTSAKVRWSDLSDVIDAAAARGRSKKDG